MAVLAVNEVLPRGYSHQFGGSPTASMVLIVTVDEPTPQQDILAQIGYSLGTAHPEFSYLQCNSIELTETDKFHVEVSLSFAVPPNEGGGDPNSVPWSQSDVWTFSTGTGQAACTTHFPNAKNNALTAPLMNKANDAYEGITKSEPELRATITGYRQLFPASDATRLTGAINDAGFAGGAANTWQCAGISGTPDRTVIGGQIVEFWQITVDLLYRRSTHNLLLPNAGLNYLDGGVPAAKRRCWVIDEYGDKVPSAGPLALADNGDLKQVGAGPYPPDILTFRIYPEENFSEWFGNPPPTVRFAGAPP